MNDSELANLENECEKIARNPNVAPPRELVLFFECPENFNTIYSIVFRSRHASLLYLCLNSISTLLPTEWRKFTLEQKTHIHSSLLSMLINEDPRPSFLTAILSKTLARVCRLGWIDISNTNTTVSILLQSISNSSTQLPTILKFFEELITEIHEPIKNRAKYINRKTLLKFRDESLTEILKFTTDCISSLQHMEHIKSFLNIFILSLNYDFLSCNNDDTSEDPSNLQIPLLWKPCVVKLGLLESIEKVLLQGSGDLELFAARALNQLGAVRRSIFDDNVEKSAFICRYLNVLLQVMKFKILDEDSLCEFLKAIKRFLNNFLVKDIASAVDFALFLDSMGQFTLKLFTQGDIALDNDLNTISVWSFLAYEGFAQCAKISECIPMIFQFFVEKTSEMISSDFFTSENENDFKDLLHHFGVFSINFYPEVYETIEKSIVEEIRHMGNGNVREIRFAWLIFISSSILSTTNKKTGPDLDDSIVESMIKLIPTLANMSYYIELSILAFCDSFTTIYLSSTYDNCWNDSSSLIGDANIGQISYMILELLLKNLTKYKSGKILEDSLALFSKLCIGYYSTKVIATLPEAFSLINYPQCLFTDNRLRSKFFTALTQLWANDEISLPLFYECLVGKIQRSKTQIEDVKVVFIELRGICKALNTEKSYGDFFRAIYDDLWELLQDYSVWSVDGETFNCLLSFFKEFLDSRNARIKFDVGEAYGVMIFKYISQILMFYSNKNIANSQLDENNINEKTKKVLRIVNNMVKGRYISFGVFQVYNDEVFVNTISMCFHLIGKCKEIYTYSKIMNVIYSLIESLYKDHGKVVFFYIHPSCFSTMLGFLLYAVRSECKGYAAMNYVVDASSALFYMCEYVARVLKKKNRDSESVKNKLESEGQKIDEIYESVFEVIFTQEANYLWTFSKVLLGLAVINEEKFEQIKNFSIEKLPYPEETKSSIRSTANNLLEGVKKSLDTQNKDIFLKNFNKLKQILSSIN